MQGREADLLLSPFASRRILHAPLFFLGVSTASFFTRDEPVAPTHDRAHNYACVSGSFLPTREKRRRVEVCSVFT